MFELVASAPLIPNCVVSDTPEQFGRGISGSRLVHRIAADPSVLVFRVISDQFFEFDLATTCHSFLQSPNRNLTTLASAGDLRAHKKTKPHYC